MPKPNYAKHNNRDSGGEREFHNGHDFRGNSDRRVTFKSAGNRFANNKTKNRDWSNAIRSHLEEEDIDMNLGNGPAKSNFRKGKKGRGGRQGSPLPNGPRYLIEGPTGWYRINIPYGNKYDKSYMLKLLLDSVAPLPFTPVAWHNNGLTVIFYVDDRKVAEKILSLDKKVQLPNGFKLFVKVHPGTPNVDMTPEIRERIKVVMAKRYNAANKALDLTKFHADPDLQDVFCALFKPIVFMAVLEIIEENIQQLEAICLNENRLTVFGFLKNVVKKIPNVKILHLAKNKIKDITQLDVFTGLQIQDIMLDGNPLCDKFKERPLYVSVTGYFCNEYSTSRTRLGLLSLNSEVRKKFPKCIKLDGMDLPPPISFDIAPEGTIPDRQQTFLCAVEGEAIVRLFLEQYFAIYDSKNRQPLLEAYHEHAMFSFTMGYPYGLGRDKNVPWLNWYHTDNRNITRVQDLDRRCKLLKQGKLGVVSFLQDMPETQHDIHSFTVDLTVFTPTMLCLTVTGMFKELNSGHKTPPVRYFFRTLVIVPAGSGFSIANEELHVTNATPDQAKEAFKTPTLPAVASGTAAPPSTPEASPIIHTLAPPMIDNNQKQEMVNQIALKTGMNAEWSIKCLEGNDWDFMRACTAFDNLQSRGAVPPEAFVK